MLIDYRIDYQKLRTSCSLDKQASLQDGLVGQPLGRWQQVLLSALAERDSVGVRSVVKVHLGRTATRTEIEAARRAAHSLDRGGLASVAHVTAPTAQGGGVVLMVAQRDLEPASTLSESASQAIGLAGHRLGRWQQVVADALADHSAVGLRSVVEGHLGRRATRAELTAARRAAHLLERGGRVKIEHVRVPTAKGRKGAILLVVVRPDVAPTDMLDDSALRVLATRHVAPANRTKEALAMIGSSLQTAAASSRKTEQASIGSRA